MAAEGKAYLDGELTRLGFEFHYGEGNYLSVKLPFIDSLAYRLMLQEGVMVRMMTPFHFPNSIRISTGREDALLACVNALEKNRKK